MGKVVGVEPAITQREPQSGEIDDYCADMSKCNQLFGDVPETNLLTGIERTYDWLAPSLGE